MCTLSWNGILILFYTIYNKYDGQAIINDEHGWTGGMMMMTKKWRRENMKKL